jgi:hypothetical protein
VKLPSALTQRRQDGFKAANVWVANGIAWLDDIQSFYRERSAIEKEYSAKLNALAKKYFEKKTRKSASLSVGDNPTMTPGSLERYGCWYPGKTLFTPEAYIAHPVPRSRRGPRILRPWKRGPTNTNATETT